MVQFTCVKYTQLVLLAQQTYKLILSSISITFQACAKDLYETGPYETSLF